MSLRVLHVLSQRPGRTGSGVTLDALVRQAAAAGHEQQILLGTPFEDPTPLVGNLDAGQVSGLRFGDKDLDFALPGMSDVMPYASSRFSCLEPEQLEAYRIAWRERLGDVLQCYRPDVVHSHHVWLLSSWLKDWLPSGTPVLTQCHATGFRQMELCPHLAPQVIQGCGRNEAFCVLHRGHARELERRLRVPPKRIHRVGAGYRDDLFFPAGRASERSGRLLYVGKLSGAKGLPSLLDAFETMDDGVARELWVVGSGGAPESAELAARMEAMSRVRVFGAVDQARLAQLMRQVDVCVLPSFYEGLPLVLVEAYACGCRLVATDLDGIRRELAPGLKDALLRVPAPPMRPGHVDVPEAEGLGAFQQALGRTCLDALVRGPVEPDAEVLRAFSWSAVFSRVEALWRELSDGCRGDCASSS